MMLSVYSVSMRSVKKVAFKIGHWWFHFTRGADFGRLSAKAHIAKPLRLDGTAYMYIEEGVYVHEHTWLGCYNRDRYPNPELTIGKQTVIGHFCHLSCAGNMRIGENVLIADHVTIADSTHEYGDVETPVLRQPFGLLRNTSIGDGSWIADKCTILGANIGKHCVIGANSVVTKDIPDYCVAAGNPAKILKRYDPAQQTWVRVQDDTD
jgi:acetyltransferase-like isoleucine patch superfamily enzyme